MPSIVLHDVTDPWTTSAEVVASPAPGPAPDVTAMSFAVPAAPAGMTATLALPAPSDLTGLTELRFWARADRTCDGTASHPFLVEIGYDDGDDGADDDHRWLVPSRAGRWEHHRIGIGLDRRSAVTTLRLRFAAGLALRFALAELLAVDDEPVADVEDALVDRLAQAVRPPGVAATTTSAADVGATKVLVAHTPALRTGNRVRIAGADADPDRGHLHDVDAVAHDVDAGTTTLTLDAALTRAVPAGSTVTVTAPIVRRSSSADHPRTHPEPAVLVDLTDQREDLARAWSVAQRDSFRRRDTGVTCSVRPPPRPLLLEYQALAIATDPVQAARLRGDVLSAVGTQQPLRVGGVEVPVAAVPAPVRDDRGAPVPAPVVVQIGSRAETGPRTEVPWVRTGHAVVAPLDAPDDTEAIGWAT